LSPTGLAGRINGGHLEAVTLLNNLDERMHFQGQATFDPLYLYGLTLNLDADSFREGYQGLSNA
jgi:hypothetical protein